MFVYLINLFDQVNKAHLELIFHIMPYVALKVRYNQTQLQHMKLYFSPLLPSYIQYYNFLLKEFLCIVIILMLFALIILINLILEMF